MSDSDKTFKFTYHNPLTGLNEEKKGKLFLSHYTDLFEHDSVELMAWEPDGQYWENFATLSINTDYRMMDGEFIANHDNTALVASLAKLGLFEPTGQTFSYGYVQNQPVYRITDKAREIAETPDSMTDEPDESMDGDHQSALESVYGPDDDPADYEGGSLNGCEF